MENFGIFTEPETIRFERLLPGPIERVWAYLTEPEKRAQWLAAGKMELRVGGSVELNFNHDNLTPHEDPIPEKYKQHDEGSTMEGKVTQLDPPRLLSYTWGEDAGFDSEVTFELTPQDDKVLLVLTHRRLGNKREMLKGIAAGWHTHLGILVDKLNNKEPKPFWKVHSTMEEKYEDKLPPESQ